MKPTRVQQQPPLLRPCQSCTTSTVDTWCGIPPIFIPIPSALVSSPPATWVRPLLRSCRLICRRTGLTGSQSMMSISGVVSYRTDLVILNSDRILLSTHTHSEGEKLLDKRQSYGDGSPTDELFQRLEDL